MRYYIYFITYLQHTLVGGSVLYLMTAPIFMSFYPDLLPSGYQATLFSISLSAVTFVMAIRPLADLFKSWRWLRSLVILRKGFGVVSASIIVSFILSKIMMGGLVPYVTVMSTGAYWSLDGYALLAHLGDITAIILLLTSNNLSKRLLGKGWKRVQKLAYVYFYAGALYEVLAFSSSYALACAVGVTTLVLVAFIKNRFISKARAASAPAPMPTRGNDTVPSKRV